MGAPAVLKNASLPALRIFSLPGRLTGPPTAVKTMGRQGPPHSMVRQVFLVSFYFFAVVLLLRVARGFDFERSPFAISPLDAFGRPACVRSFSAIAAISSGA